MSIEAFKDQAQTAAEITDEVNAQLPQEKARALREMAATAKEIKAGLAPVTMGQGVGMPMGSLPPIIYHRWNHAYPGCWTDQQFKDEFFSDNPDLCYPGYKPKAKPIYFNMSQSAKINHGGNLYWEKKNKVWAEINEAVKRGDVI